MAPWSRGLPKAPNNVDVVQDLPQEPRAEASPDASRRTLQVHMEPQNHWVIEENGRNHRSILSFHGIVCGRVDFGHGA